MRTLAAFNASAQANEMALGVMDATPITRGGNRRQWAGSGGLRLGDKRGREAAACEIIRR